MVGRACVFSSLREGGRKEARHSGELHRQVLGGRTVVECAEKFAPSRAWMEWTDLVG